MTKTNTNATDILASALASAAEQMAFDAIAAGGVERKTVELSHDDAWGFIADSVRLVREQDAVIRRFQEERAVTPAPLEAALRAELEKERAELTKLRADYARLAACAVAVAAKATELAEGLDGPELSEVVEVEDWPSSDSSIRDVMEFIENGEGAVNLTSFGRKQLDRLNDAVAELSELAEACPFSLPVEEKPAA